MTFWVDSTDASAMARGRAGTATLMVVAGLVKGTLIVDVALPALDGLARAEVGVSGESPGTLAHVLVVVHSADGLRCTGLGGAGVDAGVVCAALVGQAFAVARAAHLKWSNWKRREVNKNEKSTIIF